jgi:hypothetical protein
LWKLDENKTKYNKNQGYESKSVTNRRWRGKRNGEEEQGA